MMETVLGIGAALGAGIAIVFGPMCPLALQEGLGVWPLLVCAFLGGLLVTALVWQLSRAQGQVHTPLLLLVGVAINALASAGLGLLSHLASDIQLRTLTFWLLGSLGGSFGPAALVIGHIFNGNAQYFRRGTAVYILSMLERMNQCIILGKMCHQAQFNL